MSKRDPWMCPKRASRRYSVTREDCQLDPRNPKNNKIEIRGTISPALRHSLAKVPIVNVSRRIMGIDFAINTVDNCRRDKIDTKLEFDINGTVEAAESGDGSLLRRYSHNVQFI